MDTRSVWCTVRRWCSISSTLDGMGCPHSGTVLNEAGAEALDGIGRIIDRNHMNTGLCVMRVMSGICVERVGARSAVGVLAGHDVIVRHIIWHSMPRDHDEDIPRQFELF